MIRHISTLRQKCQTTVRPQDLAPRREKKPLEQFGVLLTNYCNLRRKVGLDGRKFVSCIAALIALAALATSIYGSYLLQIGKDEKELSETISKATPAIIDVVSNQCKEPRGDLGYSNTYAQAQFELDKIVDFLIFTTGRTLTTGLLQEILGSKYVLVRSLFRVEIAFTSQNGKKKSRGAKVFLKA
jgi:hypothetical protein